MEFGNLKPISYCNIFEGNMIKSKNPHEIVYSRPKKALISGKIS